MIYGVFLLTQQRKFQQLHTSQAEADPGFPVGGGGADLRRVHFLAKTYAKMKEMDPVGGARAGGAPWIRQCQVFTFTLWI